MFPHPTSDPGSIDDDEGYSCPSVGPGAEGYIANKPGVGGFSSPACYSVVTPQRAAVADADRSSAEHYGAGRVEAAPALLRLSGARLFLAWVEKRWPEPSAQSVQTTPAVTPPAAASIFLPKPTPEWRQLSGESDADAARPS